MERYIINAECFMVECWMFHGGMYIVVNFIWKMLLGLVILQMMVSTNTQYFSILNKYMDLWLDNLLLWDIYEV